ncbi:3-hydroxyisobutyrate dehydrogenase [Janthinobacterium sp. JC611]|uniref:3-hydroxyisobutyrate dehydrogenase n=1 Tax=Janthinobacterium sp. JC611 TaxID=2816201 RepID=UPI001BFD771D|nr:3-hydroxyisobutyrate dehydrogenase [Janthinobacterium sp. JC611]
MSSNIVFIGLGNMGLPMAHNLVRAGHAVTGFDLLPASVRQFADGGGLVSDDQAAAIGAADIVITMLPASRHVLGAYLGNPLGDAGILAQARPGTLLIDCSTISTEAARQVGRAAQDKGMPMLDAPVSGGTAGATNGTLTFMVGGEASALAAARPCLDVMGKAIFHAGGSGCGQTVKICNNMLLGILMIGTSEAIRLGVANGLDAKVVSDVMAKSSGRNWTLDVYNPCPGVAENVPASRGYTGGFGVDLMLKDLGLAVESALASGASVPLGALSRNLYSLHSKAGAGTLDFSSIYQLLGEKA